MTIPYYLRDKFEWSDSGRELLIRFQLMVRQYGGPDKLADCIESEWVKEFITNSPRIIVDNAKIWTKYEIDYLMAHYREHCSRDISLKLGRSHFSVRMKILRLQKRGKLYRKVIL